MPQFTKKVEIVVPTDSPDYLRCMDYLLYRELGVQEERKGRTVMVKYTMEEYAARYGIHPNSVYKWLKKWDANGLLKMCREAMMVPIGEEVIVANRRVVTAYPEMVERMVNVVLHGKNDRDRIEAFKILEEKIVKPVMETRPEVGSEEASYIEGVASNPHAFDPLALLEEVTPSNSNTTGTNEQEDQ